MARGSSHILYGEAANKRLLRELTGARKKAEETIGREPFQGNEAATADAPGVLPLVRILGNSIAKITYAGFRRS